MVKAFLNYNTKTSNIILKHMLKSNKRKKLGKRICKSYYKHIAN